MNWFRILWLGEKIKKEVKMNKMWYESKTLWANVLAVVAIAVQGQVGFILTPELQMTALGVINIILRAVTKHEVNWTSEAK